MAEIYQFTLQINSSLEKKQMIEVLKYLYSNKIAIKEIDEYGKKIYLLNTKEKKIEEKYLHLIDEIGKNED